MPTLETLALRPETAAYLINLALAGSLICGLALVAGRLGQNRPAPVRHGILVAALGLVLLSPGLVWVGQDCGLVRLPISIAEPPPASIASAREALPSSRASADEAQPSAPAPVEPAAVSSGVSIDSAPVSPRPIERQTEQDTPSAAVGKPIQPFAWWQPLGGFAAGLWLTGIVIGLVRLAWGCGLLLRLRRTLEPLDGAQPTTFARRAADALRLKDPPPVLTSPAVPVPLSLGLWRPAVVLPKSLAAEAGEEELEAVLIHELAHIVRRDHWIGLGQRTAMILFWWNPLVWKLCDAISELREEICDNYVLECHGEGHRLARVLLDLVAQVSEHRPLPVTVGVLEPQLTGFAGRIKRLVNKEHDMSTRMSLVSMLMVFLGSLAVLTATVMWGGIQVVHAQEPIATTVQNPPAAATPEGESFTFRGRVVAPNDEPVEGAKIYVVQLRPNEPLPVKVRATTGPDGAFQFAMAKAELVDVETSAPGIYAHLVAVAEGFGPAVDFAATFDPSGEILRSTQRLHPWGPQVASSREPVLKLVEDDVPLAGRIVDLKGQPVAGVSVRVRELYGSRSGGLKAWLREAEQPKGDFYKARMHLDNSLGGKYVWQQLQEILPNATTDADGRFTLPGLGRERVVSLLIAGPGIATQAIEARTQRGPTLHLVGGPETWTYYGAAFEHVAQFSVPIVGTVRDRKTGQPLAGVTIESRQVTGKPVVGMSDFIRTVTDAQGRYRLVGMPVGEENSILAAPAADQPYFVVEKKAPLQAGQESSTIDFELDRGIWIRGRVTDSQTGDPVRGYVEYFVVLDSPNDRSAPKFEDLEYHYFIDKEGRYAIPGLPRRGIVTVNVNNYERYPWSAGAEKIDAPKRNVGVEVFITAPTDCIPTGHHALAAVDPPKGAESVEQDFVLHPHQILRGMVLDPEGQPLAGTSYLGLAEKAGWRPLDSAQFTVMAYEPHKPRTLLFVQREMKLAGGRVLQGEVQEPLTVKLEPWGVAIGRVVDEQGKPMADIQVWGGDLLDRKRDQGWLPDPRYVMTDAEGRFRVEGLVPGMRYGLIAMAEREVPALHRKMQTILGQLVSDLTVKSGETKDLGDLKIQMPERPKTK